MTMQYDLFHGPRYWWAAYCRRWQKVIHSSINVLAGTAILLFGMVGVDPSFKGYAIAIYWLLSLQVCYDDAMNRRVYLGWAVLGVLVSILSWSVLASEGLYLALQFWAVGASLYWAYTAGQRKYWREWWSHFTYWEHDPDDNRNLTAEELCTKFGMGHKPKPTLEEVESFLKTMKRQGYAARYIPVSNRTPYWTELHVGVGHRVDYFLRRGVVPPSDKWLQGYIDKRDPKRDLLIRKPT